MSSSSSSDMSAELSAASESYVMANPSPSASASASSFSAALSESLYRSGIGLDAAADSDDQDELDSLPSISTSVLSPSDAGSVSTTDAQREWEASLEQLQLMLTMVLVPFLGKYMGRKFAYWSWARYMEWAHDVEIRWTNKKAFAVAGAVSAATTL